MSGSGLTATTNPTSANDAPSNIPSRNNPVPHSAKPCYSNDLRLIFVAFKPLFSSPRNIDRIDSATYRKWVADHFSTEWVGQMFEEYYRMLLDLAADG